MKFRGGNVDQLLKIEFFHHKNKYTMSVTVQIRGLDRSMNKLTFPEMTTVRDFINSADIDVCRYTYLFPLDSTTRTATDISILDLPLDALYKNDDIIDITCVINLDGSTALLLQRSTFIRAAKNTLSVEDINNHRINKKPCRVCSTSNTTTYIGCNINGYICDKCLDKVFSVIGDNAKNNVLLSSIYFA